MKTLKANGNEPAPEIAIIDYGIGNRGSVVNAFRRIVGEQVVVSRDPEVIKRADGLVLPGVGAFPAGMGLLSRHGLVEPLEAARLAGKPILGICLGEQLFFEASEEGAYTKGLGWLAGVVRPVWPRPASMNVGWREVQFDQETALSDGLESNFFYHVHSCAAEPDDATVITARSDYAIKRRPVKSVVTGVQQDNLYGVQFHPEISNVRPGLQLLENFARLCEKEA